MRYDLKRNVRYQLCRREQTFLFILSIRKWSFFQGTDQEDFYRYEKNQDVNIPHGAGDGGGGHDGQPVGGGWQEDQGFAEVTSCPEEEGGIDQEQEEEPAADGREAADPSVDRVAGPLFQEVRFFQAVFVRPHPGLGVAVVACDVRRPEAGGCQKVGFDPADGVFQHEVRVVFEELDRVLLDVISFEIRGVPFDGIEDAGPVEFFDGFYGYDGSNVVQFFFCQVVIIVDKVTHLLEGDAEAFCGGVYVEVQLVVDGTLDHGDQGDQEEKGKEHLFVLLPSAEPGQDQEQHGQKDYVFPVVSGKRYQNAQQGKIKEVSCTFQACAVSLQDMVCHAHGKKKERQAKGRILPQADGIQRE